MNLACLLSVLFVQGFSAEALRERVHSSHAVLVITSDELLRGGKTIPLKPVVDRAVAGCHSVKHVLVLKRTFALNFQP
jgi:acetyl-CoA synthetase